MATEMENMKRLKVLRGSRTGKKSSVTKRLKQLENYMEQGKGRRATDLLMKCLHGVYMELEQVCTEISNLSQEYDVLNDLEDIRFEVETCAANVMEYLERRKDDPASPTSSVALNWVKQHAGQFESFMERELQAASADCRYTYSRPATPRVLPKLPVLANPLKTVGTGDGQKMGNRGYGENMSSGLAAMQICGWPLVDVEHEDMVEGKDESGGNRRQDGLFQPDRAEHRRDGRSVSMNNLSESFVSKLPVLSNPVKTVETVPADQDGPKVVNRRCGESLSSQLAAMQIDERKLVNAEVQNKEDIEDLQLGNNDSGENRQDGLFQPDLAVHQGDWRSVSMNNLSETFVSDTKSKNRAPRSEPASYTGSLGVTYPTTSAPSSNLLLRAPAFDVSAPAFNSNVAQIKPVFSDGDLSRCDARPVFEHVSVGEAARGKEYLKERVHVDSDRYGDYRNCNPSYISKFPCRPLSSPGLQSESRPHSPSPNSIFTGSEGRVGKAVE